VGVRTSVLLYEYLNPEFLSVGGEFPCSPVTWCADLTSWMRSLLYCETSIAAQRSPLCLV